MFNNASPEKIPIGWNRNSHFISHIPFFNHSCLLSSPDCLPFTPFILSPTLLFSVGRICSCTHRRGGGDSRRSTGWRCGGRRGREMITAVGGSQVFAKEIFIVHVVCGCRLAWIRKARAGKGGVGLEKKDEWQAQVSCLHLPWVAWWIGHNDWHFHVRDLWIEDLPTEQQPASHKSHSPSDRNQPLPYPHRIKVTSLFQ